MNIVDIQSHFNNVSRVKEDLNNYGISTQPNINVRHDPFEKIREEAILSEIILRNSTNNSILDVGCGVGSLVLRLLETNFDARGIDLSENMVEAAKTNLNARAFDSSKVKVQNFLEYSPSERFDSIVLNGVIWYYQDKESVIEKITSLLKPGGYTFVVHRNDFFNLFALNEGTLTFFARHFLDHLSEKDELMQKMRNEIPGISDPIHNNNTLAKPYDNPLTIASLYQKADLIVEELMYTYIHPIPPRFGQVTGERYKQAQDTYGKAWQGMFLGSQFLVIARKNS